MIEKKGRTISIPPRDQTKTKMDLGDDSTISDGTLFYLNEIGSTTLLTAEQEVELAKRIEAGRFAKDERFCKEELLPKAEKLRLVKAEEEGERARDELAEKNLKLVVSVARRYKDRGLPLGDLIQNGNLGLLRAVDKFDYTRGFRFSTYATWWIRQAVMRSLTDHANTVRIPVHMNDALTRLNNMLGNFIQEHGREPDIEESARLIDIHPDTLRDARRVHTIYSLDIKVNGEDKNITLGDSVVDKEAEDPEEIAIRGMRQENIRRAVEDLPSREREVLQLRYGLVDGRERTLEEVGIEFGVTRERIRQLEAKAINIFRKKYSPRDF
ncbi:MAG: RNA polymerase sigma factor [Candidatus Daviesbacteria bacterium GW2011_GWA1_36_8]|nr:MAG: RNA polymerase sigma factor [Candidatus Daviesbacteria bacterium GW2011_GWB1_36_5]KKQ16022.1 MAG: RNA polymerase sigma factor [Candidatus Daviesbacteria bacterium GW2011_GWA1_36_8]